MNLEEFEAFFRKHYARLVRHLVIQGFPSELASDAAENAMIKLLDWTEPDEGEARPEKWIRIVAYREAIDLLRREALQAKVVREEAPLRREPFSPESNLDADTVVALLRALPRQQRTIMAWHIDGFTPAEIASALELNRATVDSNLRHARARLRSLWNEHRSREEAV